MGVGICKEREKRTFVSLFLPQEMRIFVLFFKVCAGIFPFFLPSGAPTHSRFLRALFFRMGGGHKNWEDGSRKGKTDILVANKHRSN
mmetsp:Transcript_23281/g.54059  ORF Transcript_23281/g.54059 Transcript_23281/m.54059 type:complete len:87 (-) Transcript_23281:34-294(-)